MKLLFCRYCADVVKLKGYWTWCDCGDSAGRYLSDGARAEIAGVNAECLGIDNNDMAAVMWRAKDRAEWWRMEPGAEGVRVVRVALPPSPGSGR